MDFDLSKENIQPLRGGRNATQLGAALQAQNDSEYQKELLQQKEEFENIIKNYKGPDPLENWYNYISWIEQSYPKHGHEGNLAALLEDCLGKFEYDQRYLQDRRLCKLFIKYFDLQHNPLELFQLLYSRGFGTNFTDFYRAWAYYYEANGDFKRADHIFQLGFQANAQPQEELKLAYDNFTMAVGRHVLRGSADTNHLAEKRRALTSLRTYKHKHRTIVPSQRTGTNVVDYLPGTIKSEPSRPSNYRVDVFQDSGEEGVAGPSQPSSSSAKPKSILDSASKQIAHKENLIKPGPWNNAFQKKSGIPSSNLNFTVHEDDAEQEHANQENNSSSTPPNQQPPQPSASMVNHFADLDVELFIPEPNNNTKISQYNINECYVMNNEFSFEELNARKYFERKKLMEQQEIYQQQNYITNYGNNYHGNDNSEQHPTTTPLKQRLSVLKVSSPIIDSTVDQQQNMHHQDGIGVVNGITDRRKQSNLMDAFNNSHDKQNNLPQNTPEEVAKAVESISSASTKLWNNTPEQQPVRNDSITTHTKEAMYEVNNLWADTNQYSYHQDYQKQNFTIHEDVVDNNQQNYLMQNQQQPQQQQQQPFAIYSDNYDYQQQQHAQMAAQMHQHQMHTNQHHLMSPNQHHPQIPPQSPHQIPQSPHQIPQSPHQVPPQSPHQIPPQSPHQIPQSPHQMHHQQQNQQHQMHQQVHQMHHHQQSPHQMHHQQTAHQMHHQQNQHQIHQPSPHQMHHQQNQHQIHQQSPHQMHQLQQQQQQQQQQHHLQQANQHQLQHNQHYNNQIQQQHYNNQQQYHHQQQQQATSQQHHRAVNNYDEITVSTQMFNFNIQNTNISTPYNERKMQQHQQQAANTLLYQQQQHQQQQQQHYASPIAGGTYNVHQKMLSPNLDQSYNQTVSPLQHYSPVPPTSASTPMNHSNARQELFPQYSKVNVTPIPQPSSSVATPQQQQHQAQPQPQQQQPPVSTPTSTMNTYQNYIQNQQYNMVTNDHQQQKMNDESINEKTGNKLSVILENSKEYRSMSSAGVGQSSSSGSSGLTLKNTIATPGRESLSAIKEMSSGSVSGASRDTCGMEYEVGEAMLQLSQEIYLNDEQKDEPPDYQQNNNQNNYLRGSVDIYVDQNSKHSTDSYNSPQKDDNPEDIMEWDEHSTNSMDYAIGCQNLSAILTSDKPVNPFDTKVIECLLKKARFPNIRHTTGYIKVQQIPKISPKDSVFLKNDKYLIDKVLGKGTFGTVFKANNMTDGGIVAVKYQRPSNFWEFYICKEIQHRIKDSMLLLSFMDITKCYYCKASSLFISEFSKYGSLLNVANKVKKVTGKLFKEVVTYHFVAEMIRIVAALHQCQIIHADIKPDNFLVMRLPPDSGRLSLQLIDFGCSIDMTLFPSDMCFYQVVTTEDFTCNEMREGKPWTYQTDLYCIAATAYVMLMGEYMKVKKEDGDWIVAKRFPRYVNLEIWRPFFRQLLNIESCDNLPDLTQMQAHFQSILNERHSDLTYELRQIANIMNDR